MKQQTILFIIILSIFSIFLLSTIDDTGITVDERFYFYQTIKLSNSSINFFERYQDYGPPHHDLFMQTFSIPFYLATKSFLETSTALRLGTSVLYILFLIFFYVFVSRWFNKVIALAGTVILIGMPRVFFHSHLLAIDFPVMVLYFISTILFYEAYTKRSLKYVACAGLALGATLATKINAYSIFIAIAVYVAYKSLKTRKIVYSTVKRFKIPVIILVFILSAIIFFLISPQYYKNPLSFIDYLRYHSPASRYDKVFIFNQAHEPTDLISYLFLPYMLITTFNAIHVFIMICGFFLSFKLKENKDKMRYLLFMFVITSIFLSSPLGYKGDGNGERYLLMLFPFVALFAGVGSQAIINSMVLMLNRQSRKKKLILELTVISFLVLTSAYTLVSTHPFQSSYFNAIAGGSETVAKYNTFTVTYWLDELKYTLDFINNLPENTTIYAHPQASPYLWYKEQGFLRKDITIDENDPKYIVLTLRQSSIFPLDTWASIQFDPLIDPNNPLPVFVLKNNQNVEILRMYKMPEYTSQFVLVPYIIQPSTESHDNASNSSIKSIVADSRRKNK